MPTYEYECRSCQTNFEAEQRISDPPRADCPSCGSGDTHRLISLSTFVLKGSGWYVTDYGKGKHAASSRPTPKAEPSKPATDSPGTTPKPAPTT